MTRPQVEEFTTHSTPARDAPNMRTHSTQSPILREFLDQVSPEDFES